MSESASLFQPFPRTDLRVKRLLQTSEGHLVRDVLTEFAEVLWSLGLHEVAETDLELFTHELRLDLQKLVKILDLGVTSGVVRKEKNTFIFTSLKTQITNLNRKRKWWRDSKRRSNRNPVGLQLDSEEETKIEKEEEKEDLKLGSKVTTKTKKTRKVLPPLVFPPELDTPEVKTAFERWRAHRRGCAAPMSRLHEQEILDEYKTKGKAWLVESIQNSIHLGWKKLVHKTEMIGSPGNGHKKETNIDRMNRTFEEMNNELERDTIVVETDRLSIPKL